MDIVVTVIIGYGSRGEFLVHIVFGDAGDMFALCIHLRVGHF
jgi:hypothetical protein